MRHHLIIIATTLLVLLTVSSTSAGLEPIPYEHFCQHRLHMVDYRLVKLYAHNLLEFPTGRKFAAAIQKCKHHAEHQEIRCGDDEETRRTVSELIKDPEVEVLRKRLHHKSNAGFECVHEFEKAVATDHEDQDWHQPVEEGVPEENEYEHDHEIDEASMKENIDFFHRLQDEPPHPDTYH